MLPNINIRPIFLLRKKIEKIPMVGWKRRVGSLRSKMTCVKINIMTSSSVVRIPKHWVKFSFNRFLLLIDVKDLYRFI